MKVLCVLTNIFPYGESEPYMETEVNYYGDFDKVIVCALMIRPHMRDTVRKIPDNIEIKPVFFEKRIPYLLWSGVKALFDKRFILELFELKRRGELTLNNVATLLIYLTRAHFEADKLKKVIGDEIRLMNVVLYSYRFEYQPYVAILLKRKLHLTNAKIISRAHGYDLYEKYNMRGYIPLRKYVLNNLEYVFPCSNHGCQYLKAQHPEFAHKIRTLYLGTVDHGLGPLPSGDVFTFLSCSNVRDVKRLDRIFTVLNYIKRHSIRWIHFGDGSKMNDIRTLVKNSSPNLKVELRGSISNSELMEIYRKEPFDAFINLSDSEGLPVSIMEAMSFGIPCIATDVGGTREIVIDGMNGILVSPSLGDEQIAEIIMERMQYFNKYRSGARKTWERDFSAVMNYKKFAAMVYGLID